MSSPTAQLPPGVTRSEEPCWVLAYANGSQYESHDGEPHFGTEEAAQGLADSLVDEDDPQAEAPKPVQLTAACYMVTSLCGYVLDEDEWLVHSDTAELAAEAAKGYGWKPMAAGLACMATADCAECAEAIALYERQPGAPVPVADGQEPLIGGLG